LATDSDVSRAHLRDRAMWSPQAGDFVDASVFDGALLAHGAELIGEVVQNEEMYRLAYIRGPEGIIVALSEQIG